MTSANNSPISPESESTIVNIDFIDLLLTGGVITYDQACQLLDQLGITDQYGISEYGQDPITEISA